MKNAATCVLMCQPSASSAIDPNAMPPPISTAIIAAVMPMTIRVRRSATDESAA
jgi:hypothetical protein